MVKEEDIRTLLVALAPFMEGIMAAGKSMAMIKLDSAALLGLKTERAGTGNILIALAGGPSIPKLEAAVAQVEASTRRRQRRH